MTVMNGGKPFQKYLSSLLYVTVFQDQKLKIYVTPICLGEDQTSSTHVPWRYRIINKVVYQITECISLENVQQPQQVKFLSHVSRRYIECIINLLTLRKTTRLILER